MPRVLKQLKEQPDLVDQYVAAFAGEPALKQALAKFFCSFGQVFCNSSWRLHLAGGLLFCEVTQLWLV